MKISILRQCSNQRLKSKKKENFCPLVNKILPFLITDTKKPPKRCFLAAIRFHAKTGWKWWIFRYRGMSPETFSFDAEQCTRHKHLFLELVLQNGWNPKNKYVKSSQSGWVTFKEQNVTGCSGQQSEHSQFAWLRISDGRAELTEVQSTATRREHFPLFTHVRIQHGYLNTSSPEEPPCCYTDPLVLSPPSEYILQVFLCSLPDHHCYVVISYVAASPVSWCCFPLGFVFGFFF